MIEQEPKMDWTQVLGGGLVYLGILMFLIILNLLMINTIGDTRDVLTTTFTVCVSIYSGALIFGVVMIVFKLLKWITWCVTTPNWMKKRIRGK